jgi:fatty acid desaturase
MSFEEQILDSVNYPQNPIIGEIWAPVGLRYHALHHLFPSIPYHNLGIAHRRLTNQLPTDSLYHNTSQTTLTRQLIGLWKRAKQSTQNEH